MVLVATCSKMAEHTSLVDGFTSSYGNVKFIILHCFVVFVLTCKTALTQVVTLSPLCGSSLYDIETLKSIPYWTITRPGICYHTYNSTDPCVINLAFCKSLPLDKSRGQRGKGASQQNPNLIGGDPVILGLESTFADDNSGKQLIVGYSYGDEVDCGQLGVLMFLRCNQAASWQVPIDQEPAEIPGSPEVYLNNSNGCVYTIIADYAGACAIPPGDDLSVGTTLIIIFVVAVAAYFMGGLIYKKAAGATGRELIPHYGMWNMLTSDIKVGCGFFFSCITCHCQGGRDSSPDAYDAI